MFKLQQYATRHAITVTLAVIIAIIVEWRFAASQEGWVVLAALLTSQTTRGTPFKQGLYFFILIASGIVAAALLAYLVPSMFLLQVIATMVFVMAGIIVFYYRPLQDISYFTIILFPLVLLLTIMLPEANLDLLSGRLMDALVGAVIAMTCGQLVFPVRPYKDMVMGLSFILKAFANYSNELSEYFVKEQSKIKEERAAIEHSLQVSGGMYPEWVYETGFNPGLRAGYRYFLVNVERISEIFFSINSLIEANVKQDMSLNLRQRAAEVARINGKLVEALSRKLNGKVMDHAEMDLMSDVDALEKEAGLQLPGGLDLLGFTQEYAQMTMLVRNLKDVRQLLLQLLLSVPE